MSAGVLFLPTKAEAESTAPCTSPGCIDAMPKSSPIRRRPARASQGSGLAGVLRQLVLRAREQLGGFDRQRLAGDFFEAEAADLHRLAVFGDLEVLRLEAADDRAVVVADDDVNRDELGV